MCAYMYIYAIYVAHTIFYAQICSPEQLGSQIVQNKTSAGEHSGNSTDTSLQHNC